MSGVGSSGKSGTPPIGHGPNPVVRSTKPREDNKKNKDRPKENQEEQDKEGHDEFAVLMDASLFHLKNNDIIDGWVTKIEADNRILIDSLLGSFHIDGTLDLAVGDNAVIQVIKSGKEIEGILTWGADIELTTPINVAVTPASLHSNPLSNKETMPYAPTPEPIYGPLKKPTDLTLEMSDEEAANLISRSKLGTHASTQVHPPNTINYAPLVSPSIISLIDQDTTPTEGHAQVILKKQTASGHGERPSLSFFYQVYKNKHPETLLILNASIHGYNNTVPSGLAFFFAGLVFKDVKTWLGDTVHKQMVDHPALRALEEDFKNLRDTIHCLANENWRLMILQHPNGGEERAIHLIANIQSGQGQDSNIIDMRTIITQLDFRKATNTEKPLGQVQIEASLMPNTCDLTLRLTRSLDHLERTDIEQMSKMFFAKAGLNGHVLFAPFDAGHINFQNIVNELSVENNSSNIST
jgi:hypothetical protein